MNADEYKSALVELGPYVERLRTMTAEARRGALFVDLGVRLGNSTNIFLENAEAMDHRVVGVDIDFHVPDQAKNPRYKFILSDSVTALHDWVDGPIYLCFHDNLHIAEHVICELYYAWPLVEVGGYCVFHDTAWPDGKHDGYLGVAWDRPEAAIRKFFRRDAPIDLVSLSEQHGLTVIRKLSNENPCPYGIDWLPIFEAHNRLLALLDGKECARKALIP